MPTSIVSAQGRDLAWSRLGMLSVGYMQHRAYLITVQKTRVHLIHALEDFGQVVIR